MRFRPNLERLDGRCLLSGGVVPFGFIGPPRAGWVRIPPPLADGVSFNGPPRLGWIMEADLDYTTRPGVYPVGTTWTETVTYQSSTSTPTQLSGGVYSCDFTTWVPGTYTLTAVTTYQLANPTAGSPPAPTTADGSIFIPAPDTVVKGTAQPAGPNSAVIITDSVLAGGEPVGPYFAALAEENIPTFTWWNGTVQSSGGWGPSVPNMQFNWASGRLSDQFALPSGLSPGNWGGIPIGTVLCTFTQQTGFEWGMTTPSGNDTFFALTTTLSWTWTKINANQWQAQ